MIQDSTVEPILPMLQAVGKIPSGVFILTTGRGRDTTGLMVSFVQQVSFEPLAVLVAIRTNRPAGKIIETTRRFTLNVCHAGNKTLLRKFAKSAVVGEESFADMPHLRTPTGGLILQEACAYIECEFDRVISFGGDHDLYLGFVRDGQLLSLDSDHKPMVHIRHDGSNY